LIPACVTSRWISALVDCTLERAVGYVGRDVQERAGGRGDRDPLIAADVPGIQLADPVDPDAWAAPAGLLADHGHVDVAIERGTNAPRSRRGVMAHEGGVAAGECGGEFGSERRDCGERHQ
jgi:hypothetical protein